MGRRIAVTGRGGTGKSTFAALAARFLPPPKLLLDADPDQSLGAMLGVDPTESGTRSVSEALYDLQAGKVGKEIAGLPLVEKVEYLMNLRCLHESKEFDLITLGVKWTRGCYCGPNDILRALIPQLAEAYAFTIVDSPAGLEHVNRRVLTDMNDIIAVVDPSAKSVRNTESLRRIAEAVGLSFENLYVVANCRFNSDPQERLGALAGARYLGKIEYDPAVEQHEAAGRSLWELPEDCPACVSVKAVLQEAGYLSAE